MSDAFVGIMAFFGLLALLVGVYCLADWLNKRDEGSKDR